MASSIPIIAIGASAGGVESVAELVRTLPHTFPGAVLVAMHFPPNATSVLPRILERAGTLPAVHPKDGQRIEAGHIYVAPPDHHLVVMRKRLHVVRGPRENGNRPAIDPMFRSAAVSHRRHVIGVVLTGNLDDGTAGLAAIKRHGGIAIVQDPQDALFPSMPASAIEHVAVDHVLPLARIGSTLVQLATRLAEMPAEPRATEGDMKDQADRESRFADFDLRVMQEVEEHPGHPSQYGCPDCGGVLWEIEDGQMVRYRCRVGHAWSADGLLGRQVEQLDEALWTALRALEETASLTSGMAARSRRRGNDLLAVKFERDSKTATERAKVIRDALLAPPPASPFDASGTQAAG